MRKAVRSLLALSAFFIAATALAACGGVPSNSVATVGKVSISKAQFDHWLPILVKQAQQQQQQQQQAQASPLIPDPPAYTKCIAQARSLQPAPVKGQATPKASDTQLKQQCVDAYKAAAATTIGTLTSSLWVQGEAKDLKISVSQKAVRSQFATIVKQSYPNPQDLQTFLKQSGLTIPDILFQITDSMYRTKIQAKVTAGESKVTDAQVAAFYASHKSQFSKPESRDLLIVLTKSKSTAQTALAALKHGQSFKSVAKRYSTDAQTKSTGGLLAAVTKGSQDQGLDTPAFKAPKGKLEGPVKGQFGYYVFEVKAITKSTTQTLAQADTTIRQQIVGQRQSTSMTAFVKGFSKKWKARTTCRKAFATPDTYAACKNSPKPKASATTSPVAPTQTPTG